MFAAKAVNRLSERLGETLMPRDPAGHRPARRVPAKVSAVKLLLVEDNAAMQTTLQRSFERRGMQVVACGDGARALDRWHASLPDVVLLDLSLPGLDGLQVLAQARAAGLTTPVLILTARGTVGDRILGLNTGADDYLPKPFDLDELEARVRALARRAPGARSAATACRRPSAACRSTRTAAAPACTASRWTWRRASWRCCARCWPVPDRRWRAKRLLELVFPGTAEVQADAIEVVAYRLRKKIAGTDAQLVTLRGLGYLLKAAG